MIFGYARVSTDDQETHLQIDALKTAGCDRIFQEKMSGTRSDRPELKRLLDQARKGGRRIGLETRSARAISKAAY